MDMVAGSYRPALSEPRYRTGGSGGSTRFGEDFSFERRKFFAFLHHHADEDQCDSDRLDARRSLVEEARQRPLSNDVHNCTLPPAPCGDKGRTSSEPPSPADHREHRRRRSGKVVGQTDGQYIVAPGVGQGP